MSFASLSRAFPLPYLRARSNPGEALSVQGAAVALNNALPRPPGLAKKPPMPGQFEPQEIFLQWYGQFAHPNGALAAIQSLRARLSYSGPSENVEQAIADLAPLVGAQGSRSEKYMGEGPDDLWLWPEISLVLEAKTGNERTLQERC